MGSNRDSAMETSITSCQDDFANDRFLRRTKDRLQPNRILKGVMGISKTVKQKAATYIRGFLIASSLSVFRYDQSNDRFLNARGVGEIGGGDSNWIAMSLR